MLFTSVNESFDLHESILDMEYDALNESFGDTVKDIWKKIKDFVVKVYNTIVDFVTKTWRRIAKLFRGKESSWDYKYRESELMYSNTYKKFIEKTLDKSLVVSISGSSLNTNEIGNNINDIRISTIEVLVNRFSSFAVMDTINLAVQGKVDDLDENNKIEIDIYEDLKKSDAFMKKFREYSYKSSIKAVYEFIDNIISTLDASKRHISKNIDHQLLINYSKLHDKGLLQYDDDSTSSRLYQDIHDDKINTKINNKLYDARTNNKAYASVTADDKDIIILINKRVEIFKRDLTALSNGYTKVLMDIKNAMVKFAEDYDLRTEGNELF